MGFKMAIIMMTKTIAPSQTRDTSIILPQKQPPPCMTRTHQIKFSQASVAFQQLQKHTRTDVRNLVGGLKRMCNTTRHV